MHFVNPFVSLPLAHLLTVLLSCCNAPLITQVADEAGIEVQHDLAEQSISEDKVSQLNAPDKVAVEEDRLAERLRALRPQTS